jgi:monoamine oxidase
LQKIKQKGDGIGLELQSGATLRADYVIFTPSAGVLKWAFSDGELFEPHLSNSKVEAIRHVGFGTVGKIYMRQEYLMQYLHTY